MKVAAVYRAGRRLAKAEGTESAEPGGKSRPDERISIRPIA